MTSLQIWRLQVLCQNKLHYLQPPGLPELLTPWSTGLTPQQLGNAEEIRTLGNPGLLTQKTTIPGEMVPTDWSN